MTTTSGTAKPVIDPHNPWPGLVSFPEEAERFFHGRDAERDDLLRLIRRETLTLLYGQSGLGKSSLLMAGLFPLLRREHFLPVYVRLVHSPGSPPLEAQLRTHLLAACRDGCVEAPAPRDGESTWELLHRSEGFWDAKNYPVTPVLVIDQFEEIFTEGARRGAEARSRRFLSELGDLIDNHPPEALLRRLVDDPDAAGTLAFSQPAYKVVLSLREDYLPELGRLREHTSSTMQNFLRLLPMRGNRALEAVQTTGGDLVQPDVALGIVRFLARADAAQGGDEVPLDALEIAPALLSVFCRELNLRRQELGLPRITPELVKGSQAEILSGFYNRSFQGLDPRLRAFVEDELLTASGLHRGSRPYEDALGHDGVTPGGIETLVQGRLLRLEERFGTQWVEITHDVLTGVARESRDRRHAQERRRAQQRALRRRIVSAAAFALVMLAAALAWSANRSRDLAAAERAAEEREKVARVAADSARVQKARYEALSRDYRGALTALTSQQAQAKTMQKLAEQRQLALTDTAARLARERAAAASAQALAEQRGREALVGSEAAQYYRGMTGRLVARRVAADSSLSKTAEHEWAETAAIQVQALGDRQRALTRAARLERAVCELLGTAGPPANGAAVQGARSKLDADLTALGAPLACADRGAGDGSKRADAP